MRNQDHNPSILPAQFYDEIQQVIQLTPDIFRIRFQNKQMAYFSLPGQFINIKITDSYEPFWRRPFSIHNVNRQQGWVEILFRIMGKGTTLLSQKSVGDLLNSIGPLGRGFIIPQNRGETALVIAGGLGIAPLLYLCAMLSKNKIRSTLFWGVKTASEFCCLDDFEKLSVRIHLATEDGSEGYPGLVTQMLERQIDRLSTDQKTVVFACGPNPMLQKVSQITNERHLPCQVSLETLMACGIGACLGCGVNAKSAENKYLYVCKHGPVFQSSEIELSE